MSEALSADQLFSLAVHHHREGDEAMAARIYLAILAMPPIHAETSYNLGLLCHRQGRIAEAVTAYSSAIRMRPEHADAVSNLATILRDGGDRLQAVTLYRRSIVIRPESELTYFNMAAALRDVGALDAALHGYRRAAQLRPGYDSALADMAGILQRQGRNGDAIMLARCAISMNAEPAQSHLTLGYALQAEGRLDEAAAALEEGVRRDPTSLEGQFNLGMVRQMNGQMEQAIAAYRQVARLKPDQVEAYCNMAMALGKLERRDEALALFRQALAIWPEYSTGYSNFGVSLRDDGLYEQALEVYQRAIRIQPNDSAYSSMAAVLSDMGRQEDSIEASRRAIECNPLSPVAHFNLGSAFKAMNKLPEAEAAFRDSIKVNEDFYEGHFTLSQVLLHQMKFEEGWREYEWRWRLPQYVWLKNIHGDLHQPFWEGEPIPGKTLIIYSEQGLGDAIQYVRYIPKVLAASGAKVVLAVHPPLKRLCQSIPGIEVTTLDQIPWPHFDYHCRLLSLPRIFKTDFSTIPAEVPYLGADPAEVARWSKRIGGKGRKVGIVWAGNPTQTGDKLRSPRLEAVKPLFADKKSTFVVLQMGKGRDELDGYRLPDNVVDLGPEITDMADSAAIMSGLDLMITSCTAPLHLSAALGVKTWGLIPFAPHFLWYLGRTDNPWYPTLTLYQQEQPGRDWSNVTKAVFADLKKISPKAAGRGAGNG